MALRLACLRFAFGYGNTILVKMSAGCSLRSAVCSLQMSYTAKRAGHKSKRKKRGSATYSTEQEEEVSKIFVSDGFQVTLNGFEF